MSEDDLGIVIDQGPALNEEPPATPDTPPIAPATPVPDPANPVETEEEKQAKAAQEAFQNRSYKRKAEALERELAELKKAQTQTPKPEVPAMPDPATVTVAQYQDAQAKREEAIRQAALYDAQQQSIADQQRAAEQARQMERQQALNKAADEYTKRAVQLGVKPEELKAAGELVQTVITDEGLVELILNDEHGPLITKYLSQNPTEAEAIANLVKANPYMAGSYIASVVKPKAASLKPKVSSAPPPQEKIGSALMLHDDDGVPGVTYE